MSIFFFGVPHRGIAFDDVVGMVNEEPENQGYPLVQDVLHEAKRITTNTEQFLNLIHKSKIRIVSFYETKKTPMIIKV